MRRELREDVQKLHEKIDAVHIQTTKTNGRVSKLEEQQSKCPGKLAMESITKDSAKDTKEYKLGNFLLTVAGAAAIVIAFYSAIELIP